MREISTGLDKKFLKRSKKFPEKKWMLEPDRFNFGMELETWIFGADDLDLTVGLINYGGTSWNNHHYHIPAIHMESSTLFGSKSHVRRNIERLEKLVVEQYDIEEVRYASSYRKIL